MKQKYEKLRDTLQQLAEEMSENQSSVLKLLNKHIMCKSKKDPVKLNASQGQIHLPPEQTENQQLRQMLTNLFNSKCQQLQVFASPDRLRTFLKTMMQKNTNERKLDLSVCNFPAVCSKIINKYLWNQVTKIDLSQNELDILKINRIFHPQLCELVLQNCGLLNNSLEYLFDNLKYTPIMRLCLSSPLPIKRNILTRSSKLYELISCSRTLMILELAYMQISGGEELFKVCSTSDIISLDLSGNADISGNYRKLHILKIKGNKLDKIPEFAVNENFPCLEYLDISWNKLVAKQFNYIFKAKPSLNIKTLIADQNPLMYSLENFEKYMRQSSSLDHLSIKKCRISEQGMRNIIIGIEHNTDYLKHLNLSYNKVSKDSCVLLAEALKTSGLEELVLIECEIPDEGGQVIAQQLKTNRKMLQLNLTQNRLNMLTGHALVVSLLQNKTLTDLRLAKNAIAYDHMKQIRSSIERNVYLKHLAMRNMKPKIRQYLPEELQEQQKNAMRRELRLRMETRELEGLLGYLGEKCKQKHEGYAERDPESLQDYEVMEYQQKLSQLAMEIHQIQTKKELLVNTSPKPSPSLSGKVTPLLSGKVSPKVTGRRDISESNK